tara:strand:+ start:2652 stop:3236 length:585 start_codon:yes stop_codon:yes gene_type:complete
MKKLNGINKKNIAVFISGRGSNLKSLIEYSKLKKSRFNVKLVITNKKEVKGLGYARKNKITNFFVNYKNRNKAEKKILFFLRKNKINIICLAGFMKILSGKFIKKFKGKILNTHPSLLPKYKGLNTHQRVINDKEKYSGFTIHLVNEKLDSGKKIFQKKIRILKKDNVKTLEKKILKFENKYYPIVLSKFLINL